MTDQNKTPTLLPPHVIPEKIPGTVSVPILVSSTYVDGYAVIYPMTQEQIKENIRRLKTYLPSNAETFIDDLPEKRSRKRSSRHLPK